MLDGIRHAFGYKPSNGALRIVCLMTDGLVGDDILLESRIIAVADVFEAMAAARPYRAALGADLARSTIVEGSGDLFDPAVVEALEAVLDAGFDFATVDHGPG